MTAKPAWVRGLAKFDTVRDGKSAAAWDPAAFVEAQYMQYYSALFRYLVVTGSDPADADEIAQEAFLRMFRALTGGEHIERPKQWVIAVAHNVRIDRVEKTARTAEADKYYVVQPEMNQEEATIHVEKLRMVRDAIGQLTSRQRTYLHLRAEGLLLREIAELHGVSIQSVAEACARAVQTLGRLTNE